VTPCWRLCAAGLRVIHQVVTVVGALHAESDGDGDSTADVPAAGPSFALVFVLAPQLRCLRCVAEAARQAMASRINRDISLPSLG
jgi:hypothetical protein